jgi:hypothetical protein
VLQELVIQAPILEWLSAALRDSDRNKQAARAGTMKKLQARYDQIEARLGTMSMDKLEGRITQEFFDGQATTWRREQAGLLAQDRGNSEGRAGAGGSGNRHASPKALSERVVSKGRV